MFRCCLPQTYQKCKKKPRKIEANPSTYTAYIRTREHLLTVENVETRLHRTLSFQARTHGVAFQLLGENALDYLERRECSLGGYVTHITLFHPRDGTKQAFPVLLYMATDANRHWLGPAPFSEIAEQVCSVGLEL